MSGAVSFATRPPTLCQVVAMVDAYRKMMIVAGLLPIMTSLSPFLLQAFVFLTNSVTDGSGFITSVSIFCLVAFIRRLIWKYAPSKRHRDDTLTKIRWILPLTAFVFVRVIIELILAPILRLFLVEKILLRGAPSIPTVGAIRIAGSMALLGMAMGAQYIGKLSIVRCSTFPLASHPIATVVRTWMMRVTSLNDLLSLILIAPSDTPGILMKNPFKRTSSGPGRRFQRPTFPASIFQIAFAAIVGLFLSSLILPFLPSYVKWIDLFLGCSCSLLAHLSVSLNGTSHELDPKKYRALANQKWPSLRDLGAQARVFVTSSLLGPFVAILASFYGNSSSSSRPWLALGFNIFVVVLCSLYLTFIDLLARFALCCSPWEISRLAHEITGEFSPESTLDVILSAILHGDVTLIGTVWAQTQNPGSLSIEDEEVGRNDIAMGIMANVLLRDEPSNCAGLDQDILRTRILESFGADDLSPDSLSLENRGPIASWIKPENSPWVGGNYHEPLAVPLVRALCTYSGGIGVALARISSQKLKNITDSPSATMTTPPPDWVMPPGAVACAEWAILGAARFVVASITSRGTSMVDWRSNHLSMMVPVVLHSAFELREGILKYDETRDVLQRPDILIEGDMAGTDPAGTLLVSPDVRSVVLACNRASLLILDALKSLEGRRNQDVQVHSECRRWLETMMSHIAPPTASSAPLQRASPSLVPEENSNSQKIFI